MRVLSKVLISFLIGKFTPKTKIWNSPIINSCKAHIHEEIFDASPSSRLIGNPKQSEKATIAEIKKKSLSQGKIETGILLFSLKSRLIISNSGTLFFPSAIS